MPNFVRRIALCVIAAFVGAYSAPLAAQQPVDTAQIRTTVRAAIETYQNYWLRAWVQSESDRHPVLAARSVATMRMTHENGEIGGRPSGPGWYNDTMIFQGTKPLSRVEVSNCRRLDERWTLANGKVVSLREQASEAPVLHRISTMTIIESRHTSFNVCPSWYLGPQKLPPWDERRSIDEALSSAYLAAVKQARAIVVRTVDSALRALPSDPWLVGQAIRFRLDERNFADAGRILSDCSAAAWWCDMLRGHVQSVAGDPIAAEATLRRAVAAMPSAERCQWTDVRELLSGQLRELYERMPCATQDSVARRLWWLADPLWTEPGNDRFTEQLARRTLLALRTALPRDERFDWRDEVGSDARRQLVLRYGWPAYMHWPGLSNDTVRLSRLRVQPDASGNPSAPNVPFVSYEYPAGRIHLVPGMRALWEPFRALQSDWTIASPPGGDTVPSLVLPRKMPFDRYAEGASGIFAENARYHSRWVKELYPRFVDSVFWWPDEHYAAPRRLMPLPTAEFVVLRRQTHDIVAVALNVTGALDRPDGSRIDSIALVVTPHPDTITIPVRATGATGAPIVLSANIEARPTMIGVELPHGANGEPAARTRFGLVPPPALSVMSASDRAMSDPVLLRAVDAQKSAVSTADALAAMAPTSVVTRGNAIGLYWETYGFAPTDSVTIAIRIERHTPESDARKLAVRLNLVPDRNTPVLLTWKEAGGNAGRRVVIDGPIPIVGRLLSVETGKLPRGDYWVDVAVEAPGRDAVWSRKSIKVR